MIIEKKLLPLQPFVIPLNGLTQGGTRFDWDADVEFFGNFDNSEILDAGISVEAYVEKASRYIGVDCRISGEVTVQCDRCLEDLRLPVDTGFKLSVKFGDEAGSADAGDREIVMVPEGESELDLSQFIYDYICISLPMRRVHAEGQCNPDAVRYLKSEADAARETPLADSPFAALKDMMK